MHLKILLFIDSTCKLQYLNNDIESNFGKIEIGYS